MFEWIDAAATWIRSWLSADMGLWGLFLSAFVSATVLPGSSEVVMIALITAYPELAWPSLFVATAGNVIGCALTFAMGWGARQGFERFQKVRVDTSSATVQRLRRWGPPALFLSFIPLVGDAFVLAAGWLKLPPLQSLLWAAAGKAARYLFVVLSMKGLLAWAA
jgi:membrane protein YqaA with SNARE-associated domain